jgi:hypothetical protein
VSIVPRPASTNRRDRFIPGFARSLAWAPFSLFATTVGAGGDQLGWQELPNTRLRPHCPSEVTYPDLRGGTGCRSVFDAWGGAAFDAAGNRMLITGGGHADYAGNEVYELDLDDGVMRRLNAPSYPVRDGCVNGSVYADGRPVSRHAYNHLEYMPGQNLLFLYGGSRWQCGYLGDDTWTFDPALDQWTARSNDDAPSGSFGLGVVRDPVSGLIYARDDYTLYSYDSSQHAWSVRSQDQLALNSYRQTVIDPLRRRYYMYVAGARRLYWYDIANATGMLATQSVDAPSCSFMDEDAAGWVYEPQLDRLVAWGGGDPVQLLDPDTATCSTLSHSGGPAANANGTYGRFRYSPKDGVIVSCNDIDENCYTLRLVPASQVFANGFE